jgi:hypothetical protein
VPVNECRSGAPTTKNWKEWSAVKNPDSEALSIE